MLKLSKANAKLKKLERRIHRRVYSFNLPAGHSCPFARECEAKVVNGKIVNGKNQLFRCYASSLEALYPSVHKMYMENFNTLRRLRNNVDVMASELNKILPFNADVIRVHSSGDFYSQPYFDAWLKVARDNPTREFYAYTKSLSYWINRRNEIPSNMRLIASYGGRMDGLIDKYKLPYSIVVYNEDQSRGVPFNTDDYEAYLGVSSRLLIHGTQKKRG